jgi:NAD(P)-dependent dehydrogenase (short-subunit alcohol dehydrogenase family)
MAAYQEHVPDIDHLTDEHFDRTLKTNLYGYFYMAREAVKQIPYGGAIVNTGSVTGIEGSKNLLDYSMTKGGIHALRALWQASWNVAFASTRLRPVQFGRRSIPPTRKATRSLISAARQK